MYARQDIVVLDDVLSALDATTEGLVVDRLLGKTGIFRRLGSTVVLATHAGQSSLILFENQQEANSCPSGSPAPTIS